MRPSVLLCDFLMGLSLLPTLLPPHLVSVPYREQSSALSVWHSCLPEDILPPTGISQKKQKSWDKPRVDQVFQSLLLNCCDERSKARLLAACSSQSGAWLNAPPVSSLGLRMSNDTVCISIGLRVGAAICQPHTCAFCGKQVGQLRHHGLSCTSSQGRTVQYNSLNNIIYRSLASAKVPSRLEPSGLHHFHFASVRCSLDSYTW